MPWDKGILHRPQAKTATMSYEDVAREMTRRGHEMCRAQVMYHEWRALRKIFLALGGSQGRESYAETA